MLSTLFGLGVMRSNIVQPVPALQLDPSFSACTDSFKAEMNQWLLETFGTKEVMYVLNGNTVVMSPGILAEIDRTLVKGLLP